MEVVAERCAGVDVGKKTLTACVRTPQTKKRGEVRTFTTTTAGLFRLREWLIAEQVSLVGMESTGSYWKPVYYLLEDAVEAWLLNAAHMKNVPGRKTDVNDAQWIAELVAHGLVRPSFVPPAPIRELRETSRYRATLRAERTSEVCRLHDVLEDAGIKLSSVASDILGRSGREMLEALLAGERDPAVLADLARKKLRAKIPELEQALTGRFSDTHAFMVHTMLGHIDDLDARIVMCDARIDEQIRTSGPDQPSAAAGQADQPAGQQDQAQPASESLERTRAALCTIPGVSTKIAEVIIAETGADMDRFPTAGHLASWAGMCPGNNESAGKHKSGRTRKGDRWLRGALGQAAASASRSPNTYLAAQYKRLAHRRGKQRALVAVGHTILVAAWHLMNDPDQSYQDLGPDFYETHAANPRRRAQSLIRRLESLGYTCTITPTAA